METTTTATSLKVVTVAEFARTNKFTQIAPKVRANKNGYPFITFIDANNKAENVYFSKAAAKNVKEGDSVTKDMLKGISVAPDTKNAAGESRVKLVSSDRLDLEGLLED